MVTVVCLLVGLGEVVLYPASGLPSRIARYVLVVAASLLAGVLGKVLGLGLARARLRLERARFMHLVGRRKGENDVVLR